MNKRILNIDKNNLRELILEQRKKYLESSKLSGIGEVISGISLGVSLYIGDYSKVKHLAVFLFIACVITAGIIIYGISLLIKSFKYRYLPENLFTEICELDPQIEHAFSLFVIKRNNNDGKFLLYDNKRWKCFHFPNFKAISTPYKLDSEKNRIRDLLQQNIGIADETLIIEIIGDFIERKYSDGDKIYKKFHFFLYMVTVNQFELDDRFSKIRSNSFSFNGTKFRWFTLNQMYKNKRMIKTNKNVLDYIRNKTTMS